MQLQLKLVGLIDHKVTTFIQLNLFTFSAEESHEKYSLSSNMET